MLSTLLGTAHKKEGIDGIHWGTLMPMLMLAEPLDEHVSVHHHQLPCINSKLMPSIYCNVARFRTLKDTSKHQLIRSRCRQTFFQYYYFVALKYHVNVHYRPAPGRSPRQKLSYIHLQSCQLTTLNG